MKKKMVGLMALFVLFLCGIVSATPLTVGGGWTTYFVPAGTPPVPWSGAPYTFASDSATHLTYVDGACIGDVAAFYEQGALIGQGSPVTTEYPLCAGLYDGDQAYADGRFSRTCIDLKPGSHSIEIFNMQAYDVDSADGGYIRIDEGYCPGTTPAPEFPSMFLPLTMIIGVLGTVFYIRRAREN